MGFTAEVRIDINRFTGGEAERSTPLVPLDEGIVDRLQKVLHDPQTHAHALISLQGHQGLEHAVFGLGSPRKDQTSLISLPTEAPSEASYTAGALDTFALLEAAAIFSGTQVPELDLHDQGSYIFRNALMLETVRPGSKGIARLVNSAFDEVTTLDAHYGGLIIPRVAEFGDPNLYKRGALSVWIPVVAASLRKGK